MPRPGSPQVVVTHALRTPIGKFLGALADLSAADLGVSVVKDVLARSGLDPASVDCAILGNGRQAGGGPNVARQIAVRAGLPVEVPAYTVNMACASGLKCLTLAADAIRLGYGEIVLAGGTESMSRLPFFLPGMRRGYRLGHAPVLDGNFEDGFTCPLIKEPMGVTAEYLADEYHIDRRAQDEYALRSHQRAEAAQKAGRLAAEIAPVEVAGRKGETTLVDTDEHVRHGVTIEALAKLPPVFRPEGAALKEGRLLQQPALARTLKLIAEHGIDVFTIP